MLGCLQPDAQLGPQGHKSEIKWFVSTQDDITNSVITHEHVDTASDDPAEGMLVQGY